ncbi:MAG: tetratricopeptide repeat protein [Paludibacteraceae bacterium]|nr:tetratricopeptide repeat protein [Paludibacteraceae bacterium]
MKKTVFIGMLLLAANAVFAQKSNVNSAYTLATIVPADLNGAKAKIEPALTNPETQNWAKTWFTAGLVSEKFLEEEQKKAVSESDDKNARGEYTIQAYDYFAKAYDLDILPNEKGQVKPKFTKQIVTFMKTYPAELFNYGILLYQNKDFSGSFDAFNKYIKMPQLPFMQGEINTADSMYIWACYYGADAAIKAERKAEAAECLEIIKDKYQTETCYQLLANIYKETKGEEAYAKFLKDALKANPESQFALYSLIGYYIESKKMDEASKILDEAIQKDAKNPIFYYLKGTLSLESNDNEGAIANFEKAIANDPSFTDGYLGIGKCYFFKGKEIEDAADNIKDYKSRNAELEKAKAQYEKAATYFEKVHVQKPDNKENLRYLKNIYYRLRKDAEYDIIDAEMKAL